MEMNCPLTYSDVEGLRVRNGTCLNLSANGISMEVEDSFPVGSELKVNVSPGLAMTNPFSAHLKVVRVEQVDQTRRYKISGRLSEIA